jgi:hypothetical protein
VNLVDEMRWVGASEATVRDMQAKDEELHAEAARLEHAIVAAEPTTLEDLAVQCRLLCDIREAGHPEDDRDEALIETIARNGERLAGIPAEPFDHRHDRRSLPTAQS